MKLQTFIERMANYDPSVDKSSIIEDLKQLATNRTLLSEHLYNTIQQNGFSTRNTLYSPYAFVLHYNDLYTLRLGFWSPVISTDEKQTFIYDLYHSHDFEIYAVGYSGDGYTTTLRAILDRTPLKAGVKPSLGDERSVKLAPGHVLHMSPLYDIHRQLPPETMSASLSLIIHPRQTTKTEEAWCFDENLVPTYPGIATQETAVFENLLSLLQRGLHSASAQPERKSV
ncbi:transposase [Pseudomonas sp. B11(2017)]|uniref:transposase n=1 Tax=Pseudomonas sp. B11(2017) TaxID=1981748 RepID=UPI000A1E138C|nr:transposase [Pseudomonas sp. B11(2017)]